MSKCTHLDHVLITELPTAVDGCEDCLLTGDPWLHLRICLECGHVGCCDDSPNRHATAHSRSSGHPLIRSLEPGEIWSWCFLDQVVMRIPEVHGTTRIPPSPLGGCPLRGCRPAPASCGAGRRPRGAVRGWRRR